MIQEKIHKENRRKIGLQGSMTVEACLVVPFCFFALLSLLCPLQVLLKKNNIQAEMFQAAQMYGNRYEKVVSLSALLREKIILRWKEENGRELCYVEYKVPIPFSGLGIGQINCYQQMVVSDYQGCSMVPEENKEGFVFLAESSQVCHLYSDCTHLKVKIRTVSPEDVINLRNKSGEIYDPCESCVDGMAGENVYITSYGTRYHIRKDCSKIQRDVRKVLRSKVGNMPVCSKCQSKSMEEQ